MAIRVVWAECIETEYTIGKLLGEGGYGSVYAAVRRKDGKGCVLKIVERTDSYIRELDHLIAVRKCYKVLPVKRAILTPLLLGMEFKRGTESLHSYVRKRRRHMSARQILIESLSFTAKILTGLTQIHDLGLCHRDVKSGNIMVLKDTDGNQEPWLIDFGMSKRIGVGLKDVSRYEIVTCSYRAPELWTSATFKPLKDEMAIKHYNKGRIYDHKVDVWSVGCLLYELLTCVSCFGSRSEQDIRIRIGGHVRFTAGLCAEFEDALPSMLDKQTFVDLKTEVLRSLSHRRYEHKSDFVDYMVVDGSSPQEHIPTDRILNTALAVMNAMLTPRPEGRCTAFQALNMISPGHVTAFLRFNDAGNPDWYDLPDLDHHGKTAVLSMLEVFYGACDNIKLNPSVAYLAIEVWLRASCSSARIRNRYGMIILFMGALRLAVSYCGANPTNNGMIREHLLRNGVYKTFIFQNEIISSDAWKNNTELQDAAIHEEISCASSLLTLLRGRVWSQNAGDLRHLRISHCHKDRWHPMVDLCIFTSLITSLERKCVPGNSEDIINKALIEIKMHTQVLQRRASIAS